MICKACADAAANNAHGEEAHAEYGCPSLQGKGYSHCDCMHRQGTIEQHFKPEAVKQMVEQGVVHPDRLPNPEG